MQLSVLLLAACSLLWLLWLLRTPVLHALDVALAHARGLPAKRRNNAYLKGERLSLW